MSNGSLPELSRTSLLKASVATVLGYGPAGAGKTRSIASLEKHGLRPIVIACELGDTHGLLSLASSNIAYVVVKNHAETISVIKAMKRKPGTVEYGGETFDTVVLDSITQWGEFPLARFMEIKKWDDLHSPAEKGTGKDPRQAYGFLAEKGRQLYVELFELHAHLYIIAREGIFGDGTPAMPYFAAPELPGQKLPREVPGWPDATVRLRISNGKHVMVTRGEGGSPARVRLPEGLDNLPLRCKQDIGALVKYMTGDVSMLEHLTPEATTPQQKPAAAK